MFTLQSEKIVNFSTSTVIQSQAPKHVFHNLNNENIAENNLSEDA